MGCRRSRWHLVIAVGVAVIITLSVSRSGKLREPCLRDSDSVLDYYKEDTNPEGQDSYFEQRHVVYVRIPKTGSSTVTLLLWRFAWTRMLKVLPVKPACEGTKDRLSAQCFFLPQDGSKFDIMAEHVFYDKVSYERYFHDNTVYVTMLRQPLSMLQSTVYYLKAFRSALPGNDKVESYLRNPGGYDKIARDGGRSYTHNPQSTYFGLKYSHFNQEHKIKELISDIESDFPVVMILEKLDESLILLRRVIEWPMKDLIYVVKNVNENKPLLPVSDANREKYRKWSQADHLLYEHFADKLDREIELAGDDFQKELSLYRQYKIDVHNYCRFQTITDEHLYIPQTDYHAAFTVTRKDCVLMHVEGLVLISSIRKRQFLFPFMSQALKL